MGASAALPEYRAKRSISAAQRSGVKSSTKHCESYGEEQEDEAHHDVALHRNFKGEESETAPREWLILAGPGEDLIFEVKTAPRPTNRPDESIISRIKVPIICWRTVPFWPHVKSATVFASAVITSSVIYGAHYHACKASPKLREVPLRACDADHSAPNALLVSCDRTVRPRRCTSDLGPLNGGPLSLQARALRCALAL
jgi:hypothetical protein